MKKTLAILSCIALMAIGMGLFTLSASAQTEEGYTYTVSGDQAYITKFTGSGDVVIPETLGGYRVAGFDEAAFKNNDDIITVVIPEGITTISEDAFYSCDNLTSVTLPESLVTIQQFAFCLFVFLNSDILFHQCSLNISFLYLS